MPHALNTRIRLAHAVSSIRGSLYLAPDSPRPQAAHGDCEPLAPLLPLHPVEPARDHVRRVGALAPLDGQGRAHLRKVLTSLGWEPGASLTVRVVGRAAVVTKSLSSGEPLESG
jgi:hypothetical protein